MDIVQSFKNHSILKSATYIQEICAPLKNYGVDLFIYSKSFSNGKYIFLTTNPEWSEHYVPNVYNLNYAQNHLFQESIQTNYLISPELYPQNPTFKIAKEKFGFNGGFMMPFQNKSYREVCYFGSSNPNFNYHNFFLQNIDVMTIFKSYFKEKSADIIKAVEKEKLPSITEYLQGINIDINPQHLLPLPSEIKKQLLPILSSTRHYLPYDPEGRYLTNSERNCVNWLLKGKTADEIAIINGVSRRTIETYITRMKDKFNCNKTISLIFTLTKFGLTI